MSGKLNSVSCPDMSGKLKSVSCPVNLIVSVMTSGKLKSVSCSVSKFEQCIRLCLISGSIRDMHCYLTAEDWARFSHRFTEVDLRELKLAEKHYRDQAQTPSLLRFYLIFCTD